MKKYAVLVFILGCLLLALSGCGAKQITVNLLPNARVLGGYLNVYSSDGEVTIVNSLQYPFSKAVVRELENVTIEAVDQVDRAKLSPPYYGLSICDQNGVEISVAWCDGYWFAKDGTIYKFDYDFEDLFDRYTLINERTVDAPAAIPNARELATDGKVWYAKFLDESELGEAPENVTFSLTGFDGQTIQAEFTNNTGEDWTYGAYYELDVLLDGIWYDVPAALSNNGFPDIAYILKNGCTEQVTYDLTMYGELPAGHYRIVAMETAAEFDVG